MGDRESGREENPDAGTGTGRKAFPPGEGALDRALAFVEFLREHCPWDRRQTARSLVPHLIEEANETVEAIHADDPAALRGELGDLLLNLAFQVVVAEESGHFTRDDVIRALEAKLIRRHPQLFGGEAAAWEAIKARERSDRERADLEAGVGPDTSAGVLGGMSEALDPLLRAHRIQERVAGVGFDWDEAAGALAKVKEELAEVEEAMTADDPDAITGEIGDLLFAVVNLARLSGTHAFPALESANAKFRRRFEALEARARQQGVEIPGASLERLDALWDEVKAEE